MIDHRDAEALRRAAAAKLPRFAFDFIDGGAGEERALARNRSALANTTIVPSMPIPIEAVDLSMDLFGRRYAAPIGIAPMGLAGLVHPSADSIIAKCAADLGVPYVLSCTANTSIDDVRDRAGVPPWFQVYVPFDEETVFTMLARARAAECPVVMVTVDMPIVGARFRDRRNRLRFAPPSSLMVGSAMLRPRWTLRHLCAGWPEFPNQPAARSAHDATWQEQLQRQTGGAITRDLLRRIRDAWPGSLLLKGVLSPEVASDGMEAGYDGIVVSNHGGRQLDSAPAAFAALQPIVAALPRRTQVLFDSGLRYGEDVLKVLDKGAVAGFFGRSVLFALAAGGGPAVHMHLSDLIAETRRAFALAGRHSAGRLVP